MNIKKIPAGLLLAAALVAGSMFSAAPVYASTTGLKETIRVEQTPTDTDQPNEDTDKPADDTGTPDEDTGTDQPADDTDKPAGDSSITARPGAVEVPGSVTITLEPADGRSPADVVFQMVRVADLVNGEYVLTDAFKDSGIDLNKIETAEQQEEASRTLAKLVTDQTEGVETLTTDASGTVSVDNLGLGVYLFTVKDVNKYEYIAPFLIAMPTWSEEDGDFMYHIVVYPKHEALPEIQVQKVDSSTNATVTGKTFTFGAYSDADCKTQIATVSGNTQTGLVLFVLDYGTTYLKETIAPDGYQLSSEIVKVEINDEGMFVNGQKVDTEGNIYTFRYKNTPVPSKPDTGAQASHNGWAYAMMAAGTGLLMIGLVIAGKKTKEK